MIAILICIVLHDHSMRTFQLLDRNMKTSALQWVFVHTISKCHTNGNGRKKANNNFGELNGRKR